MSSTASLDPSQRERILNNPETILEDPDVMRALVSANERAMGDNIVDLRGIAMERLEARLGRLEETHRSVISAAYENLSGTNQIHRAVLQLLDAPDFAALLSELPGEIAQTLHVDTIKLVLESQQGGGDPALADVRQLLVVIEPGFISEYLGRANRNRQVTLRQSTGKSAVFGEAGRDLRSEACLKLDLGPDRLPALLVFGSEDAEMFSPQHGTDLLVFFAGVFERLMRRWLG